MTRICSVSIYPGYRVLGHVLLVRKEIGEGDRVLSKLRIFPDVVNKVKTVLKL